MLSFSSRHRFHGEHQGNLETFHQGSLQFVAPALLLAMLSITSGAAADEMVSFQQGQITERVQCLSDSSQSYALYLPSAYTAQKKWPLLIVMDPRGRALAPLSRLTEAAENRGYIVLSSYNTLSDGPVEPNQVALDAMLDDAQARFTIDTRRLYLAGFSGTARLAWIFGYLLKNHVAGIMGFGGGLPPSKDLDVLIQKYGKPFGFFGGAGTTDFNYREMRDLEAQLARHQFSHRVVFYDGAHAWPPEEVFARALDWMELDAMKRKLTPPRPDVIQALFSAQEAEAHSLESAEDLHDAWSRYTALHEDFAGLVDVASIGEKVRTLKETKEVKLAIKQDRAHGKQERAYAHRLRTFLKDFEQAQGPPSLAGSLRRLRIEDLKRRKHMETESAARLSLERQLAMAFVQVGFYQPKGYMKRGQVGKALVMLKIAHSIHPGNPRVWYNLAQAYAQSGRKGEALEHLARLVQANRLSEEQLKSDPYFEPLRNDKAFHQLLENLHAGDEP